MEKRVLLKQPTSTSTEKKPMNRIYDFENGFGLYLGNKQAAGLSVDPRDISKAKDNLEEAKIKAILTCRDMKPAFPNDFTYLVIPLDQDKNESSDITEKLHQAYDFIIQNMEKGSILVHCKHGCTRSASVVIYFLMRFLNQEFERIQKYVKSKRPSIDVEKFKKRIKKIYNDDKKSE